MESARDHGGGRSINAEAGRGRPRRRGSSPYRMSSKERKASRHRKKSSPMWGCIAFVFIVITLLLAVTLGGLLYKQYVGQQSQVKAGALFTDGGRAVSYLYLVNETGHPTHKPVGYVRLFAEEDSVRVVAEVTQLAPHSSHGFHVFQFSDPLGTNYGDVMALDKSSTHGCPGKTDGQRTGDLGNIVANPMGIAVYDAKVDRVSLSSFIGRTVVIHKFEDDCLTEPVGKAGPPWAQGAITLEGPTHKNIVLPAPRDVDEDSSAAPGVPRASKAVAPDAAASSVETQQQQQQQQDDGPQQSSAKSVKSKGLRHVVSAAAAKKARRAALKRMKTMASAASSGDGGGDSGPAADESSDGSNPDSPADPPVKKDALQSAADKYVSCLRLAKQVNADPAMCRKPLESLEKAGGYPVGQSPAIKQIPSQPAAAMAAPPATPPTPPPPPQAAAAPPPAAMAAAQPAMQAQPVVQAQPAEQGDSGSQAPPQEQPRRQPLPATPETAPGKYVKASNRRPHSKVAMGPVGAAGAAVGAHAGGGHSRHGGGTPAAIHSQHIMHRAVDHPHHPHGAEETASEDAHGKSTASGASSPSPPSAAAADDGHRQASHEHQPIPPPAGAGRVGGPGIYRSKSTYAAGAQSAHDTHGSSSVAVSESPSGEGASGAGQGTTPTSSSVVSTSSSSPTAPSGGANSASMASAASTGQPDHVSATHKRAVAAGAEASSAGYPGAPLKRTHNAGDEGTPAGVAGHVP